MKIVVFTLFVVLGVSVMVTESAPSGIQLQEDVENLENQGHELTELVRVKRVTCDVLSVEAKGVKLNDAACALHCLWKRRSGGYCNGKRVCVCR